MNIKMFIYKGVEYTQTALSNKVGISRPVLSLLLVDTGGDVEAAIAISDARREKARIGKLRSEGKFSLVPDFECKYCGLIKKAESFGKKGLKCQECRGGKRVEATNCVNFLSLSWVDIGAQGAQTLT